MLEENKKEPTPQEVYQVWQNYFEEQQKQILQFWTQVMNNMWGQGK
jgi:hypothetical protein